MRKILFRGKRVDNGEWVIGDLFNTTKIVITTTSNKGIYTENGSDIFKYEYIEVHPDTIGQFTGLTDKNGKEIFEGDIIKCSNYCFVIEFKYGCFGFTNEDFDFITIGVISHEDMYGEYSYDYLEQLDNFEIIGNIHDNQELLKK